MKYCVYLFLLLALAGSPQSYSQHLPHNFTYRNGDLLFQDLDCGGLCDAIEAVTRSSNGRHFSHIGLVCKKDTAFFVIEAIGRDVHLTPIDAFIHRQEDAQGRPKVVVGRVPERYQALTDAAVGFALQQLGTPYDDAFLYGNGKYYCSELIYDAFKAANQGQPFFRLTPMTFKDPSTGRTFPVWTDYYRQLGTPVPEGAPGCNPGSISTSGKVLMIGAYY